MEYYREMTDYINNKYDEDIISLLDFKKMVFGEEKTDVAIREMTEYALHKTKGVQEEKILLSDKNGKKYCLWDEKYDAKVEISEWDDMLPNPVNVDNSDSERKAKLIFSDLENVFKEYLVERIEKVVRKEIQKDILDDAEYDIKIKQKYKSSRAEDLIKEYKNIHYFSSKGISVYKSRKGLAL